MAVSTICSGVWCRPVYTTSMPASRSARATTLAPRSCPSSPGLATTTRMRPLIEPRVTPAARHGGAQRKLAPQRPLIAGAADRLARQTGRWPIQPDVLRNGALLAHVALRYLPPVHDHGTSTAGRWLLLASHLGCPTHRQHALPSRKAGLGSTPFATRPTTISGGCGGAGTRFLGCQPIEPWPVEP